MGGKGKFATFVALGAAAALTAATIASADGTETLGVPSIAIAVGSGIAVGGVGIEDVVPEAAPLSVEVPAGATVEQVLLYWEGHHSSPATGADDSISVNTVPVAGTLIGGPTLFFGTGVNQHWSSTYRADITALDLVAPGMINVLSIDDLQFDQVTNGAGIMVIYDDGTEAEVIVRDGNDLAFINFAPTLDGTAAQTFGIAPADVDRTGEIDMFFSSVAGPDLGGLRPSTIVVTVAGVETEHVNVLASVDGNEWDTVSLSVAIPANADSVTVQAFSDDRDGTGARPASFAWNMASLSVETPPPPPPPPGGEGCTPGYWKQAHHLDSWVGYVPGQSFDAVFGVSSSFDGTLLEALRRGGGGEKAFGRHAVAALLNTATAEVSYGLDTAGVIALVQAAYASGDFEGAKNIFAAQNELGCPLN